ncbi:MAG: GIY-YIG nuclease family protein [Candidatus Omnitrophica bacterium]|nr:GIY-YIG nuclease family protein [Candidatus Omnitrophota bacterium]MDD5436557.1 GIY-YIG nuclease family protein [Candidatus Omnitrophota bacterium]
MSRWKVYILKCSDGSLYTGITTDLEKRLKSHNKGTASKYTRSKRPVIMVRREFFADESSARKREAAIKKLSRQDKLKLIK